MSARSVALFEIPLIMRNSGRPREQFAAAIDVELRKRR
jgi:hypothetical protein